MGKEFLKAPAPASIKLINFTSAKVHPGIVSGSYVLVVKGTKRYVNMSVPRSTCVP